jgi:hypothetical protein
MKRPVERAADRTGHASASADPLPAVEYDSPADKNETKLARAEIGAKRRDGLLPTFRAYSG